MSARAIVLGTDGKEGKAMTRRGFALSGRVAALAVAGVLALSLAGDRGRAAAVPAPLYGQDPLEVLELKVRPNVIIVLDSSGSMNWGVSAPASPGSQFYPPQGADHPRSKVYQAKQVLKQIVANNQDKVSFMLAHYDVNADVVMQNTAARTLSSGTANRFQYWTSTDRSPSMATTELGIMNDVGSTAGRGLQSWQLIFPARTGPPALSGWNTFYFEEAGVTCTATLAPGPGPNGEKFYAQGGKALLTDLDIAGSLAADLKAKMTSPTGCTPQNTYDVTYTASSGVFTFTRTGGTNNWRPLWTAGPNNIRGALGSPGAENTAGTGPFSTRTPYTLLYRPNNATAGNTPTYDTASVWVQMNYKFNETIGSTTVTNYNLLAGRFWNGEVIDVVASGASVGQICAVTFPATTQRTNPPTITLRGVASCGAAPGSTVQFTWGGPYYNGSTPCGGMITRVNLIPCDLKTPPAVSQVETTSPWLDNEFPLDSTGMPDPAPRNRSQPAPATTTAYSEAQDGTWAGTAPGVWAGGIKAIGGTPVEPSISGVRAAFVNLWDNGQAAGTPAPPPYFLDPIKDHKNPKEKTILLFVTDGAANCSSPSWSTADLYALGAAQAARNLYFPAAGGCKDNDGGSLNSTPLCADVDGDGISGFAEPASSVQTYMIGYGDSVNQTADVNRLNWVAWGGSGLYTNFTAKTGTNSAIDTSLRVDRAKCTTCQDAFIAPTASLLAEKLQGIIDQGAADGDFTAQQSITESVFEYADRVAGRDARIPSQRYQAVVPTRFVSSFALPGFRGHVRAYQNDGAGNSLLLWDAGEKLRQLVNYGDPNSTGACSGGTCSCDTTASGGGIGQCTIGDLSARIKRRIFTTSRNGVYTFDPAKLMAGTSAERVALWPPASGVLPADYTSAGKFDAEMGFPPDNPAAYPPGSSCASPTTPAQCWFDQLQKDFKACLGSNPPSQCADPDPNVKMKAARREARNITLAFMAGAAPIPDGNGLKRTPSTGSVKNAILYQARSWVLADSELATAGVVTPPSLAEPEATPYVKEYRLYRDGAGATPRANSDVMIRQGFGLARPDDDGSASTPPTADTRDKLKPVMTVVYAPANDMLHAFRAGPCFSPSSTPANCTPGSAPPPPVVTPPTLPERGGEELWGFVPYDQLQAVRLRAANEPQTRANHVYMLNRGVRFADVFVPGTLTNVDVGGATVPSMQGVWRRILYFGRGIGGKYVTALDVTAPGPYTAAALTTVPPIPLWSRGNPDTQNGLVGGSANNSLSGTDLDAYAHMGETWSMPTVAYVNEDKTNDLYVTARRKDGVDFAIFMGSGYGNPNAAVTEGTFHYTLDALSGDVIAAVDVEDAARTNGLTRAGLSYPNAIVANSVSFNRSRFESISAKVFNTAPHPWSYSTSRVFVGDLHGRLWKFLTKFPNVAIPAADLGADQPVGTAVALLGEDVGPVADRTTMIPNIFVSSGADSRAPGPFRNFSLLDKGADTDVATGGTKVVTSPVDGAAVTGFLPVEPQFVLTYDQGSPQLDCGITTEALFRGTVQPASAVECSVPLDGARCPGKLLQRVFYGGTRLSLPNTKFAPPTPLSCGCSADPDIDTCDPNEKVCCGYPCRSQFDSIIYAVGAESGEAAYDLNASGDDAYRIFRDSRIAAITTQADPDPGRGGGRLTADEGLMKSTPPKPPPPPGVPPTSTAATANVVLKREPGQPAPVVQYGSTVCQ